MNRNEITGLILGTIFGLTISGWFTGLIGAFFGDVMFWIFYFAGVIFTALLFGGIFNNVIGGD